MLVKGGGSKKTKRLRGQKYVVLAGDTVRKIADHLGVEPWQILDQERKILQWPGALDDIRPLVAGEELFVTGDRFTKVMEGGATNFGGSSHVREEEDVEDFTFPDVTRQSRAFSRTKFMQTAPTSWLLLGRTNAGMLPSLLCAIEDFRAPSWTSRAFFVLTRAQSFCSMYLTGLLRAPATLTGW
jgi:hypothetical protein